MAKSIEPAGDEGRPIHRDAEALRRLMAPPPCVYRDDKPFSLEPCQGCTKKIIAEVFKCAKHGRCCIAVVVPGVATCRTCTDRKEAP